MAEISHDLVVEGEPWDFAEGTYRLRQDDKWRVYIFSSRPIEQPEWNLATWSSGVEGIVFRVPDGTHLSPAEVEKRIGAVLGVDRWRRVKGPDSMVLR